MNGLREGRSIIVGVETMRLKDAEKRTQIGGKIAIEQ